MNISTLLMRTSLYAVALGLMSHGAATDSPLAWIAGVLLILVVTVGVLGLSRRARAGIIEVTVVMAIALAWSALPMLLRR